MNMYGLVVGLGIVVGGYASARAARKFSIKPEQVWDALVWMLIPGIIGARLYHVVDYWQEVYAGQWWLIPQVWTGGLGIYGGIIGGMVGLYLFVRSQKAQKQVKGTETWKLFFQWLDIAAFGLPVGQAIGRFGNYFNQELYGMPFDPAQGKPFWAIYIDPQHRLSGYERFDYFHPAFLYESVWSLLTFMVLFAFAKRYGMRLKSGTFFTLYIAFYSLGRFFLEYIKISDWTAMMPNQWISGIMFLVAVGLLIRRAI